MGSLRMTGSDLGAAVHVPVVVGTTVSRGPRFLKRVLTALFAAAVIGGFAAALQPWGMTREWLTALCATVAVLMFTTGMRADLHEVGVLGLSVTPVRRLYLRGPWVSRTHDLSEVVAVQVWCHCGGARPPVAPHRDGMEVFLRDGRTVRIDSGTAFPADVAVTLGELLAADGIKVIDWGEAGVLGT